ncbi:MAG: DUF6497 family protein [Pseudomonadota bacterium]
MRAVWVVLALAAAPAEAETVPSGQPIVLWQVLWERVEGQGTQAVLRFIAPQIAREGGAVGFDAAQGDMDWLCATHGLAVSDLPTAQSDSVVITLMDRPVPRGASDPQVTQFFGTYDVKGGECLPEEY